MHPLEGGEVTSTEGGTTREEHPLGVHLGEAVSWIE